VPPPSLNFVPVDFERDDPGEKLAAAGFQSDLPAFFTWLGVVPYLTQDAIGRALDYMSRVRNSEVVFDYMEPPEASSIELARMERERTKQLEKIDERSTSRFDPGSIASLLHSHGFRSSVDTHFQEIVSRFGYMVQGLASGSLAVHVVHARQ
jgi:methyltransferase (TIGR00027 family)